MRSLVTVEVAYSVCTEALGGKALSEYAPHDFDLRVQRSVLQKVVGQYPEYVSNVDAVRAWCAEYEAKKDRQSGIIAGTYRWVLGDVMSLPIEMVKSR